jgi:hypothetical protein
LFASGRFAGLWIMVKKARAAPARDGWAMLPTESLAFAASYGGFVEELVEWDGDAPHRPANPWKS